MNLVLELAEIEKQVSALISENINLKKENKELKEKLKPENCLKLLAKEGYIKFTSEQLTKAKELLKQWLSLCGFKVEKLAKDTEQFLNEVEK